MIVPPAPTIESGLNAAGGAARNSAMAEMGAMEMPMPPGCRI
jgi:hypothetical protein